MTQTTVCLFLFAAVLLMTCKGHGRLREPPSRGSMWRDGFNNPRNYNDNELNCGGRGHQWDNQRGKCGICGDPYDRTRHHEAGGRYANGIIGRTYIEGATIQVKVQVTAQHKGWFEFRLCPTNNVNRKATQECLDQHVLEVVGSRSRYRYNIPVQDGAKTYQLRIRLPQGVTCSQCVFQWRWNAGNSWGTDPDGTSCVGCGPQEQFYGCSDIAITGNKPLDGATVTTDEVDQGSTTGAEWHEPTSTLSTKTTLRTTPQPTSTMMRTTTTTTATTTTTPNNRKAQPATSRCRARKWFKPLGGDTYCRQNCPRFCPLSHCICGAGNMAIEPSCRPAGAYVFVPRMQSWCEANCANGYCPRTHCTCQ